ncbi:MFS transporter [Gordonia jinghuaiqii]|uniref:MFS transporter n=1 Tax=Gordonia jinghuaiqii TaxID=2758710 RepID=UPI003567683D
MTQHYSSQRHPHHPQPPHRHPHPWRVFAATSVGVIAVFVAMSGLTVALPTLSRELDATPAQSTWILLGYMVVTTALILVFGRLADIIGRRPLYLSGLTVFTLATALCVVSPTPDRRLCSTARNWPGSSATCRSRAWCSRYSRRWESLSAWHFRAGRCPSRNNPVCR